MFWRGFRVRLNRMQHHSSFTRSVLKKPYFIRKALLHISMMGGGLNIAYNKWLMGTYYDTWCRCRCMVQAPPVVAPLPTPCRPLAARLPADPLLALCRPRPDGPTALQGTLLCCPDASHVAWRYDSR